MGGRGREFKEDGGGREGGEREGGGERRDVEK